MKVCLDCMPFLVKSAGVKTYLFQLHRHLRLTAGSNRLTSFPWFDHVDTCNLEGSVAGTLGTYARLALLYFANIPRNPVLDILGSRIDLFHASNQIRNPPRNALLTTMVHDMTAWSHPNLHKQATVANDRVFAERIVRRAHGVIAPSESSHQDAIRFLGLNPSRVRTIYHGIDEAYFAPIDAEPSRARYGLTRPYILFLSTIEPRKNLDRLMDAYLQLSAALREQFDLIVAGSEGWQSTRTMARLHASGPSIRYLGHVPEEFLPGLMAGASVFAYPSLYEGFGLPLAQAMAAGVPAITSDVSALPEVAGDAALLVDPLSVEELRSALERLLTSPTLRAELSAAGREQAKRFHWERCATETWRFFESL